MPDQASGTAAGRLDAREVQGAVDSRLAAVAIEDASILRVAGQRWTNRFWEMIQGALAVMTAMVVTLILVWRGEYCLGGVEESFTACPHCKSRRLVSMGPEARRRKMIHPVKSQENPVRDRSQVVPIDQIEKAGNILSGYARIAGLKYALAERVVRVERQPKAKPRRKKRKKGWGATILREVIAFGSRDLRMTDAAIARELLVTREYVRQIRRAAGIPRLDLSKPPPRRLVRALPRSENFAGIIYGDLSRMREQIPGSVFASTMADGRTELTVDVSLYLSFLRGELRVP